MREMRVKNTYFNHIMSGLKPLEVRVGYDSLKRVRPGESIKLLTQHRQGIVRVKGIRTYASFAEMIEAEPYEKIVPGTNKADVLKILRDIYPPHKERLGVLVFDLEVVQKG
jgi:ASC-1-like (ASCH) protein